MFDSDPAVFTVTAINDAPVVSDIPNQTIDEGATFTTITLDNYVGDPDNADSEISWTYSGNSALSVSIDANRIATITIPDINWNGAETITFTATDPGNLADSDAAVFTVNSINDAPVVSDIPNQVIDEGSSFATIPLDNYVTDVDDDDSAISWSYSGASELTVTISSNRVATISIPNVNWSGSETITFTAIDPGNLNDSDPASFTVAAINYAPVVEGIPNQNISEGGSFNTIALDNYVSDVDNADSEMSWSYSGNTDLIVSIDANRIATISTPNSQWNGSETITFTAEDPGKASDFDAAVFSVGAQNDPPVVSGIPDQTITEGSGFATILLDNYVADPDNNDSEMSWTYSGNSNLQVSINASRIATITAPNTDWNGSETITFTATDPTNLSDSDNAQFTVTAINDAPIVSDIPNQTINEGASFSAISLDDYVADVDNGDAEMSWSYSGNSALTVSIDQNRVATIAAPDANWNGSETITFTAKDPGNLSDNSTAVFTVSSVNNAPVVSSIPDQTIDEGQSFASIPLDNYVTDSDNSDDQISWSATGNTSLQVSIDANRIATVSIPNENWNGSETITFTAKDPGNLSDSDEAKFTINAQNDAPVINAELPLLSSKEDVPFEQLFSAWYPFVDDPDNADEELAYLVSGDGGPVTLQSNKNSYTFSAPQNWFGQDTFLLKISDGFLADSAFFVVSFTSVNDAPEIINFPDSLVFDNSETYVFDLSGREKDVDSPVKNLKWQFTATDSNIVLDYSRDEKVLILTAEGFVGGAQLFAVLLDDSNAVAMDTLQVKVEDKVTALSGLETMPMAFSLSQNYPNPFNPSTTIRYSLPTKARVQLLVFDVRGRKIAALADGFQQAGNYSVLFDNSELASGLYIYILRAGQFVQRRKMLLIK